MDRALEGGRSSLTSCGLLSKDRRRRRWRRRRLNGGRERTLGGGGYAFDEGRASCENV